MSYVGELFWKSKLKLALTRDELRDQSDELFQFSSSENIKIPDISKSYPEIRKLSDYHDLDRPFVSVIDHGVVIGEDGKCISKDNKLILDSAKSSITYLSKYSFKNFLYWSVIHRIKKNKWDKKNIVPFTSAYRSDNGTGFTNYYVWVSDYLTKVEGIKKYMRNSDKNIQILVPSDPPSYVLESLKFFDLGENITYWKPGTNIYIERMIVPSGRRIERLSFDEYSDHKILSTQSLNWLRQRARSHLNITEQIYSSKVYISRSDVEKRQIHNRDEFTEYLKGKGYKIYTLSDMSFKEQVILFSQADKVISPHGAGLINLIFSSNTDVIEIFSDVFKPTYYCICYPIEDVNYYSYSGSAITDNTRSKINQDIYVNIDDFDNEFNSIVG
jgi:hypothetical protein